jgi:hypothetical protein
MGCHPDAMTSAMNELLAVPKLRQAPRGPADRAGLQGVVRREDDDGDRAETGSRLQLQQGREPHLSCASPHTAGRESSHAVFGKGEYLMSSELSGRQRWRPSLIRGAVAGILFFPGYFSGTDSPGSRRCRPPRPRCWVTCT